MLSRRSRMSEIIRVRGLKKTYHVGDVDIQALRGVDLDVERGAFLSIIGPSGSGKSTLFNVLGALAPPTEGEVWIDGANLHDLTESQRTELRQRKIGFVFQKYNLLPTLSARDNIEMARYLGGSAKPPADFDQTLALLGIKQTAGPPAASSLRRRTAARRHRPGASQSAGYSAGR